MSEGKASKVYYVVRILEPKPYPRNFPRSFHYMRQIMDCLCPTRTVSVVVDIGDHLQPVHPSVEPRVLKYIFDEKVDGEIFLDRCKRRFPMVEFHYVMTKHVEGL